MDYLSVDLSKVYVKRRIPKKVRLFNFTPNMLKVFFAIDKKCTLYKIYKDLGLEINSFRKSIAKLVREGLLINSNLDERLVKNIDFVSTLEKELILAMGPMGKIIVDEELFKLEIDRENIPISKVIPLVVNISNFIEDRDAKEQFKYNILESGYI